jgi:hypothetical protein
LEKSYCLPAEPDILPAVDDELIVTSAEVAGAQRAYPLRFQLLLAGLTTLALLIALALLPLFSLTFWFLFEAIRQKLGQSQSIPTLWPLIAATVAAWGVVFLAHDRIGALGNARAERLTLERAARLLDEPLPIERTFVELRLRGYPSDVGWLFFEDNRLRFVGDVLQVRIPRWQLGGQVRCLQSLGGLLSAYVQVGPLRLLPRSGMEHLSDARRLAPELAERLRNWLDAAPSR